MSDNIDKNASGVITNLRVAQDVPDLIGQTPLLRLPLRNEPHEIYLKLENCNPGSSVKDRAAANMIKQAELRGDLVPGSTIIESSSGNTGLSLAMIGAARGYSVMIVVDNHVQWEKIKIMRAFGATVVHVGKSLPPNQQAGAERERKVKELLASIPRAFYVNQGDNLDNRAIHYNTTAEEIFRALGPVSHFFATIGTGGTISGTAKRLKEYNKGTMVVGIEPKGSVFFGNPYTDFYVSGAGSTKEIWKNIDYGLIDTNLQITDQEAFNTCRFIARHKGLFVGGTGGMLVYAIIKYATQHKMAGPVIGIIPDGGEQYVQTIFDDNWMQQNHLFDASVDDFLRSQLR